MFWGVVVDREAQVNELPKQMTLIGVRPRQRLPSTQQLPPVGQEFETRDGPVRIWHYNWSSQFTLIKPRDFVVEPVLSSLSFFYEMMKHASDMFRPYDIHLLKILCNVVNMWCKDKNIKRLYILNEYEGTSVVGIIINVSSVTYTHTKLHI